MLTTHLEDIWRATPARERNKAIARAEMALGNLVHYSSTRRNYYRNDVERLAAELVAFKFEPVLSDESQMRQDGDKQALRKSGEVDAG